MVSNNPEHTPRVAATPGQPVIDPAGWTKEEISSSDAWIYQLTTADISELDAVVAEFEDKNIVVNDIGRNSFDFPTLAAKLGAIKNDILWGRGFAVVRGVPVERYSRLQSAIAFWCIGLHVGDPASQNAKGHLLGHVKDLGGTSLKNPLNRGYQTSERLPFHTDQCDVVSLLCLHTAPTGGDSLISSSITLHNEMLKRRPELVAALAEPLYIDRRNEIPEGKDPWYRMPVFSYFEGYLTTYWTVSYIRSAQRFEELPRHTPALTEALDMFEALAQELAFTMTMEQGDIQFLHNHVVVHSRTQFEDWPEPERMRHLYRLWLATPDGRPLPPIFAEQYAHLKPGDRPAGGVVVPGTTFTAPLEAE